MQSYIYNNLDLPVYNTLLSNLVLTLDLTLEADPNVERRGGLWVLGVRRGRSWASKLRFICADTTVAGRIQTNVAVSVKDFYNA